MSRPGPRRRSSRRSSKASISIFGLAKAEQMGDMLGQIKAYVENDGYLSGMNNLVNSSILNNPVLTALSMIPDEANPSKEEQPKEVKGAKA